MAEREITLEKVVEAIKALHDHKGSSRAALQKYFTGLQTSSEAANTSKIALQLKKALDAGVKSGTLIQAGGGGREGSSGRGIMPYSL